MRPARAAAALAALAAVASLVAGSDDGGAKGSSSSSDGGAPVPAHAKRSPGSRIVVVMMENKERGTVIGSPSAPYVNRLAARYATPRNYYGIRHPSLPNYLALVAGATFGVTSDCTDCNQRA